MAQYEEHNQLDYRFGGDTIDDFAQKHMAEITRIFRFLNDLKENKISTVEYTEPSAGQFKVENGKLYIRSMANDRWCLLGDVDDNFGFKPAEADFISSGELSHQKIEELNAFDVLNAVTTNELPTAKIDDVNALDFSKVITTENLPQERIDKVNAFNFDNALHESDVASAVNQPNKLVRTNEDGYLDVNVTGNAGKLAGIRVVSDIIQDGQVLTYRASTNTWTNENKGVIGSGKALNLYDGDELLCSYVGDETRDFDLGITANKKYAENKADEAKSYADTKSDEAKAYAEEKADEAKQFAIDHVDGKAEVNYVDEKSSEAESNAKAYADTKADTAESNAKAYIDTEKVKYFPVVGGVVKGNNIYREGTDNELALHGGNLDNHAGGARLLLCGKDAGSDSQSGSFQLSASNGITYFVLQGQNNGSLTWGGKEVATNASDGTNITGGKIWIE